MAEVLAKQPRPDGPAADDRDQRRRPRRARHRRADRAAAASSPSCRRETMAALERRPARRTGATATRSTSWATPTPERYAKALEIAAKDPNSDGLLVDPHAAGHDRPDARPPSSCSRYAQDRRQAGARELDGRRRRRGRRGDPQPGRHPDLRLSRHGRRASSTTCGATAYNLRGLYETPDPADEPTARRPRPRAAPRRSSTAARPPGRTLLTEAESKQLLAAYGIPTVETARRRDRGRGRRGAPTRSAIPVVLKLLLRDDHAQDRRRRRAAEPARRRRGARGVSRRSRRRSREQAGAEHFLGVTVQPMVKLRRLRADRRQQPRPAVRPGAAVRHGRPAGRGLQGPRAGAAAAEHHAGAPDDGADPDLHGAARASAAGRRSTWPRSSSCWSASASWSSSSAGSRRSTSTRCWPRRNGSDRAGRPRRAARAGRRRKTSCRARRSGPTRPST